MHSISNIDKELAQRAEHLSTLTNEQEIEAAQKRIDMLKKYRADLIEFGHA